MSRLLHAAARGARIQSQWRDDHDWQNTNQFVFIDWMRYYRIHPEDAHLQYGPISTALREMAEDKTLWKSNWEWSIASSATCEFTIYFDSRTGEPDYPLFYLILAEFLADEGM